MTAIGVGGITTATVVDGEAVFTGSCGSGECVGGPRKGSYVRVADMYYGGGFCALTDVGEIDRWGRRQQHTG